MPRDTERAASAGRRRGAADNAPIPAAEALARALYLQSELIAEHLPHTEDADALHDLRVAVRRSRALLKLAGDILPQTVVFPAAAQLRHIGKTTTPVRDLDVLMSRIDALTPCLRAAEPADVATFTALLRQRRISAHDRMMSELRDIRCREFLAAWRTDLGRITGPDPGPGYTVKSLADKRIPRVTAKVRRRAAAVTGSAADTELHKLRKRCKELRYLLEFCAPATRPRKALRELRRLQEALGAYQDTVVQRQALPGAAESVRGTATTATLLAAGELAGLLADDQRTARELLDTALHRFLRPRTARRFAAVTA